MLKKTYIIWLFIFIVGGQAQNYKLVNEISYPKFIPQSTSFDISLITELPTFDVDKLNLIIKADRAIDLNTITAKSGSVSKNFIPVKTISNNNSGAVFSIIIDLKALEISSGNFLQIVAGISSASLETTQIEFSGEYLFMDKVVSKFGINGDAFVEENELAAIVKTYKPQKISGSAARFTKRSELKVDFEEYQNSQVYFDFWFKYSESNTTFLKLIQDAVYTDLFSLHINDLQKLCVIGSNGKIENLSAPFASRKVWNHIAILFKNSESKIEFLLNGKIFLSKEVPSSFNTKDISALFTSEKGNPFTIEQLRILYPKNGAAKLFYESRYKKISGTLANIKLELFFDSYSELNNLSNKGITYSEIKLVTSDAPFQSRAPELNVIITNAYNMIDWICPDSKNASKFIIEKSSDEAGFKEIGSVIALDEISNNYSFIDETPAENEIIYYRINQVNKDGSSVYSAQVKIGVGIIEQFSLEQNFPNPFNPNTTIKFDLYEDSEIDVTIFDLEGQKIKNIFNGSLPKGQHQYEFKAENLTSGVYLYQVSSPIFSLTKKMVLAK